MNNTNSILANTKLLDNNRPKVLPKTSSLSQIVNAKDELSDFKFIVKLKYNFKLGEEANLFLAMLALDVDQNRRQ